MTQNETTKSISQIKKYTIIMLLAWSLIVCVSLGWNYFQKKEGAILSASEAARTQFSMDVLNRRWSAGHGGVYVPVSERTKPNPYLKNIPERDIKTPSGKLLTLVNPAYMTRQVHELGLEESHIRGHITSLNPIRSENSADKWETKALKSFEKNIKEVTSVETLNGVPHLRLMRPLITEKGCIKCHEQQGYKVGDIRGGISSSVPIEPYLSIANSEIYNLAMWHGVLWFIVVFFLGVTSKKLKKNSLEREKLNIKLRETDERLKLAVEGTREGIWDWYIQTGVTYFNKRSAEIIGYSLDELEPKSITTWTNNTHPDDLEKSNELLEKLFSGEIEFYEFESRMKHKDGEWVWVLNRGKVVEWDADGKPIRMTGTHTNISERKKAEEELKTSENKYRTMIERSNDMIWQLDNSGKITFFNNKVEKLSGLKISDYIGKSFIPVVLESDIPMLMDIFKRTMSGEAIDYELRLLTEKGLLTIDTHTAPIYYDGNITGVISFGKDITEQRKTEKDLIASKEKAENANKMKSIFLAQMSHEIRTPINALVSMSSLLRYDFEEGANQDQLMSFDVIDSAGIRIIRTIDLLLNLSEIQAGTYEELPTQFDMVADVLYILMKEYKRPAEKKNIKFSLISNGADTKLVADSYTVTQIFTQLVDNAIKFTEEGEVTVKAIRNEINQLVVEIVDTGIGIEESYLDSLFEPFSQEDMGYSRKFDGNGIGMALVKTYCKLNNAKIEVESKKDIGSTFRIIF